MAEEKSDPILISFTALDKARSYGTNPIEAEDSAMLSIKGQPAETSVETVSNISDNMCV